MPKCDFEAAVERIVARDARYVPAAYHFLREALAHTQITLRGTNAKEGGHVTPQELLGGIRDYALKEFGPMAGWVLEEWGVRRCEDFGDMVFNLVAERQFRITEQDNRDDFKAGYDFTDAFCRPFRPACGPANIRPN
jgi:hypothetical protein